jgi:hypothetical protein
MGTLSQTQKKALTSKLQRLRKRVDVEVVDAIFDEILKQIVDLKSVSCTLADDDSALCLRSPDELVAKVEMPHAKKILRLMCARLSVRCSEWAKKEVSPYGDHADFEFPNSKQLCRVQFENTPDLQRFEIKNVGVPTKDLSTNAAKNVHAGYDKDRLVLMVRNAFWLHCYWDLRRNTIERAEAALSKEWPTAKPILRLFDVSSHNTTSSLESGRLCDINIHGGCNDWPIDVSNPPRSFRVDIGYLAHSRRFYVLARSNVVTTRQAGFSDMNPLPQDNPGCIGDTALRRFEIKDLEALLPQVVSTEDRDIHASTRPPKDPKK